MRKIKLITFTIFTLTIFFPTSSVHAITEADCARYIEARDGGTIVPEHQATFFPKATTTEEAVAFAAACDKLSPPKSSSSSSSNDPPNTSTTCLSPAECAQQMLPGNNQKTIHETARDIINVVLSAISILAVIVIIIGGVQFSTSQGDPQKTQRAKNIILYALVGLLVALLAFAIVNFVLGSLTS